MTRLSLLLRPCGVYLCSALLLFLSISSAWAWPGVVVRVLDGDTVIVAPAGVKDADISVRLYGIDAPELKQKGGKASRVELKALLRPGDAVEVVGINADRYHRSAALVTHEGRTVNLEMLRQGQAWLYTKYCKASFCRKWAKAEKKARKEGLGLWAEADPTPPWQWRKEHDKEGESGKADGHDKASAPVRIDARDKASPVKSLE